jgi:hypothetical protein
VNTIAIAPGRPSRSRRVARIVAAFVATALAVLGLLLAGSQTSHASENMGVCYGTPLVTTSNQPASVAMPNRSASVATSSNPASVRTSNPASAALDVSGPGYSTSSPTTAVSGYGYVYINNCGELPGVSFTDPHQGDFQLNSAGYANKVDHFATGSYRVYYTGLGVFGGVAHVTTYGGGQPDQCRIGGWTVSGFDEVVTIYCYDINGSLTDRRFTATYTNVAANHGYGYGYLWADQPTSASYTPDSYYQYSTAGTNNPNRIVRTSTGQYQVTMTGISGSSEDVMVSTYGWSAVGTTRCRVAGSLGQTASVSCSSGGTPVDSMFTLSYASGGNLLGAPNSPLSAPPTGSLPSAYAWVVGNGGTEPATAWRFSTPGTALWTQSYNAVLGWTTVRVPVGSGVGNVQVVAFGNATAACDLVAHGDGQSGTPDGIEVQCWDSAGNTIPGEFNLFYTGKLA